MAERVTLMSSRGDVARCHVLASEKGGEDVASRRRLGGGEETCVDLEGPEPRVWPVMRRKVWRGKKQRNGRLGRGLTVRAMHQDRRAKEKQGGAG
jgi:hypothetical protein